MKLVTEWGKDLDDGKWSNEGRRKLVGTCKMKILGGEEHLISQAVQHRSSVLICLSLHVHLCFGQSSLGCGQTLLQSGDEAKSCRERAAKAKGKRKSWGVAIGELKGRLVGATVAAIAVGKLQGSKRN